MTFDRPSLPDRTLLESKLRAAKNRFSRACSAGLAGDREGAADAAAAHREVERLREELRRLDGAALGVWAESARIRYESKAEG